MQVKWIKGIIFFKINEQKHQRELARGREVAQFSGQLGPPQGERPGGAWGTCSACGVRGLREEPVPQQLGCRPHEQSHRSAHPASLSLTPTPLLPMSLPTAPHSLGLSSLIVCCPQSFPSNLFPHCSRQIFWKYYFSRGIILQRNLLCLSF